MTWPSTFMQIQSIQLIFPVCLLLWHEPFHNTDMLKGCICNVWTEKLFINIAQVQLIIQMRKHVEAVHFNKRVGERNAWSWGIHVYRTRVLTFVEVIVYCKVVYICNKVSTPAASSTSWKKKPGFLEKELLKCSRAIFDVGDQSHFSFHILSLGSLTNVWLFHNIPQSLPLLLFGYIKH